MQFHVTYFKVRDYGGRQIRVTYKRLIKIKD